MREKRPTIKVGGLLAVIHCLTIGLVAALVTSDGEKKYI